MIETRPADSLIRTFKKPFDQAALIIRLHLRTSRALVLYLATRHFRRRFLGIVARLGQNLPAPPRYSSPAAGLRTVSRISTSAVGS